jgi:L-asparagine oxygenase
MQSLAAKIRLDIARMGYCRLSVGHSSDALGLARSLGKIVPDPRTGSEIRDLVPQTSPAANHNTLSSRYGLGSFPLHTEAAYLTIPPQLLLLYCQSSGRGRRPTRIVDTSALLAELSSFSRRGTWVVKSGRPSFLAHVVECIQGTRVFRYDAECMFPRGRVARMEQNVIRGFLEACDEEAVNWGNGDVLILNNGRMLHGRGDAITNDESDRVLSRVLVEGEVLHGVGI